MFSLFVVYDCDSALGALCLYPGSSADAAHASTAGFMVPSLQGQPSDGNDFLYRFPSNKDPLDMLLLSEQSLDQLTSGF